MCIDLLFLVANIAYREKNATKLQKKKKCIFVYLEDVEFGGKIGICQNCAILRTLFGNFSCRVSVVFFLVSHKNSVVFLINVAFILNYGILITKYYSINIHVNNIQID